MCARRIRTQTEWNVAISGAGIPAGSSRAATRRRTPPAAPRGPARHAPPAAPPPLLEVPEHALVGAVARHERHDRQLAGHERDRAVLHLAARIALGVGVRDLLELWGALERDRVLEP